MGSKPLMAMIGGRNFAKQEREELDFYATNPKVVDLLLQQVTFSKKIWECACGAGHISRVLEDAGYDVLSTDIVDRGYGISSIDFLKVITPFDGDIVTNPPFKFGLEFVKKALDLISTGHKVAMFLKLSFLESKSRIGFFEKNPPKFVYVMASRTSCAMNGDFEKYKNGAMCFAWFIWEKGSKTEPIIRWLK